MINTKLEWRESVDWDETHRRVTALRRLCLGALVVRTGRLADPDPDRIMDVQKPIDHRLQDTSSWLRVLQFGLRRRRNER